MWLSISRLIFVSFIIIVAVIGPLSSEVAAVVVLLRCGFRLNLHPLEEGAHFPRECEFASLFKDKANHSAFFKLLRVLQHLPCALVNCAALRQLFHKVTNFGPICYVIDSVVFCRVFSRAI